MSQIGFGDQSEEQQEPQDILRWECWGKWDGRAALLVVLASDLQARPSLIFLPLKWI